MCYIPIMDFSGSVVSLCIITSSYYFRPLVTMPIAPTITGIIKHSLFHVRWIYVLRFLHLNSFPVSFCIAFLSDHVVRAISMEVLSLFVLNYYVWFYLPRIWLFIPLGSTVLLYLSNRTLNYAGVYWCTDLIVWYYMFAFCQYMTSRC